MVGHITHHARQRAEQMHVSIEDVILVLTDPHVTYEQPERGEGHMIYQRGNLAVAVLLRPDGSPAALSVLHRTQERYEREEPRKPGPPRPSDVARILHKTRKDAS
jgi:hypothetical protein